jgi:hypothetical protein
MAHSREFPSTSASEIASALGSSRWHSMPSFENAVIFIILRYDIDEMLGCQFGADEGKICFPAFDRYIIAKMLLYHEEIIHHCSRCSKARS